ncbi:putative adenylyltransferase/sulfurtransferase MoeZ [Methanobrevibacter cuticularis]|uniref:Putative adenylyltransferase/sulfurtransferase MoeZ n=1 Tax=Methanobrevibacter cuticularis TaxID=47311 RepID=A0A166DLD7_9EURY|nr:HesA/MoeB/ThiF family protein [Methanobrevibacter cuticularis]KZX15720.1 putative adenylyltransferase/sulfurtransferase MoeZ [Methanobrevibacter cuticularis]
MPQRYIGMGYWEIISRQMSVVTKSQQTRFKEAKIAVIGAGGIGGSVIEMLARMGVGSLTLIDKDAFDLSNLNRQLVSGLDSLGKAKSFTAKERVRNINPYVNVTVFNEELNENNIEEVIGDCDAVVDALDNLVTRVLISRTAKELNIPFIHGAIYGTMGQVSVFTKDTKSYEEMFSLPSLGKKLDDDAKSAIKELNKEVPPVIGPTPNIVGALEAFEAFKLITGIGEVNYSPKLLTFNLLDLSSFDVIEL